jgi:hypothetical protein
MKETGKHTILITSRPYGNLIPEMLDAIDKGYNTCIAQWVNEDKSQSAMMKKPWATRAMEWIIKTFYDI